MWLLNFRLRFMLGVGGFRGSRIVNHGYDPTYSELV